MEGQDQFQVITTADGSPTLVFRGEPMHSRQGAWAETFYVYGTVVDIVLARGWLPHFMSLGLGLGYVELMTAAKLIGRPVKDSFQLVTFEEQTELTKRFHNWLRGADQKWTSLFDQIFEPLAGRYRVSKKQVSDALTEPSWLVQGALTVNSQAPFKVSGIFFDAFSEATSPELWREEFLEAFLEKFAAEKCVLATYAAKGSMKRALKKKGFKLIEREGFGTKRESTLAVRD